MTAEAINLRAKLARFTDHWAPRVVAEMTIALHDREVTLRAGELFVVPKGVEHITRARAECSAMLIEPRGVPNTGTAGGVRTAENDVWI